MLKAAGADERRGAGGGVRDGFEVGDPGSPGGLGGYREGLGVCSGVRSRGVVRGHHTEACWECRIVEPTPDALSQNLHFNKLSPSSVRSVGVN